MPALVCIALHFLHFGHVQPFHRGPLGVIPALLGLLWAFESHHMLSYKYLSRSIPASLSDRNQCDRLIHVRYTFTGKSFDISINQDVLLPLLTNVLISALQIVWYERCRHIWQPQSR